MRYRTEAPFFDGAEELRACFESVVGPAKQGTSERFVWDYWHIPEQYTYIRTPSVNVLSPSLLGRFMARLRQWGRDNLGCDRATMPWLSYYVDGCRQELHSDVIQGTWSYVYSLTRWDERVFTGGETLLGAPLLLTYWESFDPRRSTESRHLLERVPAAFDQLCVFDSRLPHGVAIVQGTRSPLQGRVALHGWFHPAELSAEGALGLGEIEAPIADLLRRTAVRRGTPGSRVLGQSYWRASVEPDGTVQDVEAVVDNLVPAESGAPPAAEALRADEEDLRSTVFPAADGTSNIGIPLG